MFCYMLYTVTCYVLLHVIYCYMLCSVTCYVLLHVIYCYMLYTVTYYVLLHRNTHLLLCLQNCMSECDTQDEVYVQACEAVKSLDESDLELHPSKLESRWKTIVKLSQRCKNLRNAAESCWNTGIVVCLPP